MVSYLKMFLILYEYYLQITDKNDAMLFCHFYTLYDARLLSL